MSESLTDRTIYGLKWSYFYTVLNIIVQIVSTTVLARILNPNDYGLIAIANIILGFGSYFAQIGIGPAIIQKKDLCSRDITTAYTITLVFSSFLTIGVICLAPLVNLLFDAPDVVKILRIMSINFIFSAISMVSISLLRKYFKFYLIETLTFISFIIGNLIIAITLAILKFGVWSLVIATISQSFILLVLTSYYVKGYIKLDRPNLYSAKILINYGSKYSLSSFLEYLTYRSDVFFIGRYFGPTLMGIYNRGWALVQLPAYFISSNLIKVLFSTLNEVKQDKERFLKYYNILFMMLGTILMSTCIFISINAREIVIILLGEKWIQSINILRIISLAIPFHLLINYQGLIYDVFDFLNVKLLIKIFHFASIVLLYLIFLKYGIEGIAISFLITEFSLYIVYTVFNSKLLKLSCIQIIDLHKPFLFISIIVAIPLLILKKLLLSIISNPILLFCLQLMAFLLIIYFSLSHFPLKGLKKIAYHFIQNRKENNKTNKKSTIDNVLINYIRKIAE